MIIYFLVGGVNVFSAYKLILAFYQYRIKTLPDVHANFHDLPAVSVLVAARNEQHAMRECLDNILLSDYPKMEIIVLDDNSVDNTSAEVKMFAHSGVRFVRGENPPEGWLGRNYAYERLASEASGDLLLFLSVDTKISPQTISKMISFIELRENQMLSILPTRADNYRASVLFSTLRYYFEIIFATKKSPASSSAAWMVKAKSLDNMNGFLNFKQSISPESEIANELKKSKQKYRFLIDGRIFGVNFEKKWSSQIQTQQRKYALTFSKKPILFIAKIIFICLSLLPFFIIIFGLVLQIPDVILIMLCFQTALSYIFFGIYLSAVWTKGWLLGMAIYPLILLQELIIILSSVYKKLFGKLTWRGRDIKIE